MKSIDYLKLVSTAKNQKAGGRMPKLDLILNAVVWWGAIINLVSTAAIGITLSASGVNYDNDIIILPVLGVIPALIYFGFWLQQVGDSPRFSRLMIGLFAFGISAWIVYAAIMPWKHAWFAVVPVGIYFSVIAAVSLKQLNAQGGGHEKKSRPPGGSAA